MFYSSESSDSDNVGGRDSKGLDLSYLMLDSDTVASYLKNSIREQHIKLEPQPRIPPQSQQLGGARRKVPVQSSAVSGAAFVGSQTSSSEEDQFTKGGYRSYLTSEASTSDSSEDEGNLSFTGESVKEQNRLELTMETLSTEASGQNFEENVQASAFPLSNKFNQLRTSRRRITHTRRNSNATQQEILSKDDITEKIFLHHNILINVPFELVLFSKLKYLDLSNNNISSVNDFILHLPKLQTLYLKNNQLDDDSLPKDLSVLTKLRELNLSGNSLTVVPPQLYHVTSLRYLYLGNNNITEVGAEIKALQNLQVLHLGGNALTVVPPELGELVNLCALVLCNNKLRRLPRPVSRLTRLRSLLLHQNNLCCLPVEIVKLRGLVELSLRDNPLVTRFVNCCVKKLMFNPPSLKELAARTIQLQQMPVPPVDLPASLRGYLASGHKCVNPKCKGVYFTSCVEHIKFVDFCGKYRVPLMHYLCSSRCTSQTPSSYAARRSSHGGGGSLSTSDSDDDLKRVLLG